MNEKRITVYYDYQGLLEADDAAPFGASSTVLVGTVADYVDAYQRLTSALHSHHPLTLIVRDRNVAQWLGRAQEKYGAERVQSLEYTARLALEQRWGLAVPSDVSDREMIEAGLLEASVTQRTGQSFRDVVLAHFYSAYLTSHRLPFGELGKLVNDLDTEQWVQHRKHTLLRREYEGRLLHWEAVAANAGERLILQRLRDDPQALADALARYKVLRHYPPHVGRRMLGETFDSLAQVEAAPNGVEMRLDGLLFREEELTDAIDQIRVYFHERMQTQLTPAVLEEMVQQVSGELHAEYREVKKMLEKGRADVTRSLVQKVQEKFAPIRGRIASDLERLSLLIEPPRSQPPDPNWGATEWVDWALKSYLPYHFWQEETGSYDEETANHSEQYQDWYFKNYLMLRGQYPQMLHRAIVNIKAELGDCERVLFVVMDNFNYKFLPVMKELMHRSGYVAQGAIPYLALIPTETDVCKKCLLAGEPERSAIAEASYENILTRSWKDDVGVRSLVYLPNVKRLQELTRLDADIYFLNYRALDEVLHASDDQTGISHTEAARHHLQALVASIDEFAQRFQIEEQLTVYVTADHGSTKIAAGVVNVIDPKFYQKVNLDRHHRFVTVSDAQLKKLPDNTAFQCYVLERDTYGLEHNYLIARRYYRFMKTEDSFYVHGGLTPEETIVPFVTFRKAPLEMKEPTLTLKEDTFRYHVKSAVVLGVVNPNTFPLQHLAVALEAIGLADEPPPPLEELSALSSVELTIPCRFRREEREPDALRVLMTYECAGHQQTTSKVFTITVKAMMERQTRRFR